MKRQGDVTEAKGGLARLPRILAANRELILSIVCLAFSFFAFMALVQAEPLSFAVPASAGSFIVETILARLGIEGAHRAATVGGDSAGAVRRDSSGALSGLYNMRWSREGHRE